MRAKKLTNRITLPLAPADRERLSQLTARTPGACATAMARSALLAGLAVLEGGAPPAPPARASA